MNDFIDDISKVARKFQVSRFDERMDSFLSLNKTENGKKNKAQEQNKKLKDDDYQYSGQSDWLMRMIGDVQNEYEKKYHTDLSEMFQLL